MSETHRPHAPAADPFTAFWSDLFARFAPPGGAAPSPPADAARQMQRMFLDALAKYCDDFLRSEQFLQMMKETMDRSLAFKAQLDRFLTSLHHGAQAPARVDLEHLGEALRDFEERILKRLESLEHKTAAVEAPRRTVRRPTASPAPRPSVRAAARRKKDPPGRRPR